VRRAPFLVLAIAAATALALLPGGVAYAGGPESGTVVRVALTLKASDGLHARLENSEDGTATLELRKKDQTVTYEAPGQATEAGRKVRFGRLGRIDVAFTPTRVLNSTEPGEGCAGAPRTLREGVFTGTIDFTGEGGFVRLEGPRSNGSMSVISEWECPEVEAMDRFTGAPRQLRLRSGGGGGGSVELEATDRGCSCDFAAGLIHRHGSVKSAFLGVENEQAKA
jgi:hypothetical protein